MHLLQASSLLFCSCLTFDNCLTHLFSVTAVAVVPRLQRETNAFTALYVCFKFSKPFSSHTRNANTIQMWNTWLCTENG